MSKLLVFTFLLIHLFTHTELGQVARLPHLLSHFKQHQQKDSSLSFLEFIWMHYGGDDGTSADDDLDKQLPFHNVIFSGSSVLYFTNLQPEFPDNEPEQLQLYVEPRTVQGCPSAHVHKLIQPPRTAVI